MAHDNSPELRHYLQCARAQQLMTSSTPVQQNVSQSDYSSFFGSPYTYSAAAAPPPWPHSFQPASGAYYQYQWQYPHISAYNSHMQTSWLSPDQTLHACANLDALASCSNSSTPAAAAQPQRYSTQPAVFNRPSCQYAGRHSNVNDSVNTTPNRSTFDSSKNASVIVQPDFTADISAPSKLLLGVEHNDVINGPDDKQGIMPLPSLSANCSSNEHTHARPPLAQINLNEKPNHAVSSLSNTCATCNQTFKTAKRLAKHTASCQADRRRHACDVCGVVFNQLCTLRVHRRRHTGERPYACRYCERRFADNSCRCKHERTHTQERRYACDHCSYRSNQSSNLHRHRRKIHALST